MRTYQVQIARTETTLYTIEVKAKNEDLAEDLAYSKFADGDYDDEDIVYGEEETHSIEEI